MTFAPNHSYVGDLVVTLIAPGGAPSMLIYGRTGATNTPGSGDGSDLAGPYAFSDSAPAAPSWWTAAAATGSNTVIPAGSYRASQSGGVGSTGANTLITPAFAAVADPNGTWTLRFTDNCSGDMGSVSAANLTVDTTADVTAPAAPALTSTNPASPANNNSPRVLGSAEAGSTVRLYSTANCTGTPLVTGTAANLAAPGLQIAVLDNTTTAIKGTATDAANNTSVCSAALNYQEVTAAKDTTAPVATIGKGPKAKTTSKSATLEFAANETATFACKLTGKNVKAALGEFAPCTSPQSYKKLKPGKKVFTVRATDSAGNVGADVTHSWKVKKKKR